MALVTLNHFSIHLLENLQPVLDIKEQAVTAGATEIFTDDYTHKLELFAVRCHGVRRNDPSALTELMSESELIIEMFLGRVKAESNDG